MAAAVLRVLANYIDGECSIFVCSDMKYFFYFEVVTLSEKQFALKLKSFKLMYSCPLFPLRNEEVKCLPLKSSFSRI